MRREILGARVGGLVFGELVGLDDVEVGVVVRESLEATARIDGAAAPARWLVHEVLLH